MVGVVVFWGWPSETRALELLVADRLSNSVYRYSVTNGTHQAIISNSPDLNQPAGIGISPDFREVYVASSQNNRVMKYDYNPFTGATSNATIFADAGDGLQFPNDIRFSPDGKKIYVANLNGGVSQFNTDGSSAGDKLLLSANAATSSLNFTSSGKMLAGAFQTAGGGGVAISNADVSAFPGYLVTPRGEITGATGIMVHDDYVYVSGLFTTSIYRYSLSTGEQDPSWLISGVGFPQGLVESPDGNGFLAGILGFTNGTGSISRYAYDGTFLSTFATPSGDGFTEATAMVFVPDPPVGDFDGNGVVNAGDYVTWRKALPTATLFNDNTPGIVSASDYADWRANFGKRGPAVATGLFVVSAVPEPSSAVLLLVAFFTVDWTSGRPARRSGRAEAQPT